MLKSSGLEQELQRWREARARKQLARPVLSDRRVVNDRRTVRVNGQEVVVVRKPKRVSA
jgi:hypothetical protein